MAGPASLAEMLDKIRVTFGFRAAALLVGRDGRLARAGRVRDGAAGATPTQADVTRDLGRGITLALAGGALSAEDRAGAHRLRRPGGRRRRVATSPRRGRPGQRAGGGQRRCARRSCRRCRTTCAPRWRRSRRRSPACARRDIDWPPDVDRRSSRRRSTRRPTASTNLVGNLLDMSRLQASALTVHVATDRGRRSGAGRHRQPRHRAARRRRGGARDAARGGRRRRAAGAGARQPDRQRRPPVAERSPASGRGGGRRTRAPARRHPRHRPRARASASSTASWCSSRSSASATIGRTAPASVSGWRSPAASSRRWTGSWRSRTHRAAGPRWWSASRLRSGSSAPADDAGARRRRRGADPACSGGQPQGPRLRRRPRRDRRAGARAGRPPPPRRGPARPRAAGHGRPRGDRRAARLDPGADRRALGARRRARQGGGARRRRRRLRVQAVRDGRAARPPAGGGAPVTAGRGGTGGRAPTPSPSTSGPSGC